jgi:hypothetical protein
MLTRAVPAVILVAALSSSLRAQSSRPAYVVEGDRVEQEFSVHRDRLEGFFVELRTLIEQGVPSLVPELEPDDAPPETGVYGYQLLPPVVEEYRTGGERVTTFTYSWNVTRSYIDSERGKLDDAWAEMRRLTTAISLERARGLIEQYHDLVDNQKVIDQYVQYNRFWQREIARNRSRFDRFTEIYSLLVSGAPGAAETARDFLSPPKVPSFLEIDRSRPGLMVLHLPVYTDIPDDTFLGVVEEGVERLWRVEGTDFTYQVDVEFRKVPVSEVYPSGRAPFPGDHIDLDSHADRFPRDGALLTTGAQSTYGYVGRYVALGPGEISVRTLAHEFGHVLGFDDGYIRGYRDVGAGGFEILELTAFFEDIMSAPREGRVLSSHFELMVQGADSDE